MPQQEDINIGVAMEIPAGVKEKREQAAQRGCGTATGGIQRPSETKSSFKVGLYFEVSFAFSERLYQLTFRGPISLN